MYEYMKWFEALKKWNQGKDKWCIPRIGSDAYKAVRVMMEDKETPKAAPKAASKAAPKAAPKKRVPKAAKEEFPPEPPQLKPLPSLPAAQPAMPSKKVQEKIKKVMALNQ